MELPIGNNNYYYYFKLELEELLNKSEKSKEKATDRQKLLQSDIYSFATKNKLLKDNLQG